MEGIGRCVSNPNLEVAAFWKGNIQPHMYTKTNSPSGRDSRDSRLTRWWGRLCSSGVAKKREGDGRRRARASIQQERPLSPHLVSNCHTSLTVQSRRGHKNCSIKTFPRARISLRGPTADFAILQVSSGERRTLFDLSRKKGQQVVGLLFEG